MICVKLIEAGEMSKTRDPLLTMTKLLIISQIRIHVFPFSAKW